MQFRQCCWNFSPEVWTIIAQSPKTNLKNSERITFLKVLLWTSELILTTWLKDFNECSKNCAHSPERTKTFLTKSFSNLYVALGWWNSVWITMPRMIQRKNQKMFPGRPKKIRESKISFNTFLPIAHLETIVQIW